MLKETYKETKEKMDKTISALKRELAKIRTGRANPSLIEELKVDYYGTPTPMKQLAGIAVPEPRLIVIQPWDKNSINDIEKSIQSSDLGLNPSNDGNVIRIPFPPLTEETRKDIVKQVKKISEESRISIRNIRHESNEFIKELEKSKEISEDQKHTGLDQVQKIHDKYIDKINEITEKKEKEVMEE